MSTLNPFPGSGRGRVVFGPAFLQVLEAAQVDAPWAYQRLYEWLGRPVSGYLRGQGLADPDGLTNDVFLRAFNHLGNFHGGEDRFRSWIFAIAHNVAVDERRRVARRPRISDAPVDEWPASETTETEAFARLGAERVSALLGSLSDDQRDVLMLRIVADLTVEQVAETLAKTPGAVKQLQRRGLLALRRQLDPPTEAHARRTLSAPKIVDH